MGEQRIALVTGGNRGIGLEVCRQLAGLHMRVILGSRDETKGVAAAKQLATAGLSVEARQLDVASGDRAGRVRQPSQRDPILADGDLRVVVRPLSDLGDPVHKVDCIREIVEPELTLQGTFDLFPTVRRLERHTASIAPADRATPSACRRQSSDR